MTETYESLVVLEASIIEKVICKLLQDYQHFGTTIFLLNDPLTSYESEWNPSIHLTVLDESLSPDHFETRFDILSHLTCRSVNCCKSLCVFKSWITGSSVSLDYDFPGCFSMEGAAVYTLQDTGDKLLTATSLVSICH